MTDRSSARGRFAPGSMRRPPLDLPEHLAALDKEGLLVRIDRPIDKDSELHPLVRWQFLGGFAEDARRAFLFTDVRDAKGRRYPMPVVVGALAASPRIYAMGMGCPVEDIGPAWNAALAAPVPPLLVDHAPCQEIVITGAGLQDPEGGVAMLPVPVSSPGFDAAPYLTATLCITRDPETHVQNMGMYRAALKASDRLAVRMVARPGGAGGYVHWLKYRARNEPMPIAIAIGAAPIVCFTAPQKLGEDVDELAVAGGALGEAVRVARCVSVDLNVPADAEIVIEGIIPPDTLEPEAPFGESNGYVALEAFNMPVHVTAITMKKKAIFTSIISQVTPSESSVIKKVAYEPLFLAHLTTQLGVTGIKRVAMHERLTNLRPVILLQFAAGAPKTEIWRGLNGAANFQAGCGKIVIAVSEDIDPDSLDAVFWSMAYRSNPIEDVHIAPYHGILQGSQYGQKTADSMMLIDATLKEPMPPLALPARAFMEKARGIWEELGLPHLTPSAPWHGYALGDWNDVWETFAVRAAQGEWQANGKATEARTRKGLKPETPGKAVEKTAAD